MFTINLKMNYEQWTCLKKVHTVKIKKKHLQRQKKTRKTDSNKLSCFLMVLLGTFVVCCSVENLQHHSCFFLDFIMSFMHVRTIYELCWMCTCNGLHVQAFWTSRSASLYFIFVDLVVVVIFCFSMDCLLLVLVIKDYY